MNKRNINKRKNSKPIYKRVWFWILITFLAIGVINSISKNPSKNTENTKSATTEVASSSSSEGSESTENSKEEKGSKSKSKAKSSQKTKNDGPEYTEASNTEFANHLTTEINNQLGDTGFQITTQPVGNNVIHLYLPQDVKYYSKVEIQQIADKLYQIKESTFKNWAIENGYDLSYANSPHLYVKAEDNTTLAEESGIVNKSMKVKVNN